MPRSITSPTPSLTASSSCAAALRRLIEPSVCGFSIYRASHHDTQPNVLHTVSAARSRGDVRDAACGLCLNDPRMDQTPGN